MQRYINHELTIQELDNLVAGQYYIWNNIVYVKAKKVDDTHVDFICPFCYTRYKKNGDPTANARHEEHKHSSDDRRIQMIHKIKHCDPRRNEKSFFIGITPSTRDLLPYIPHIYSK